MPSRSSQPGITRRGVIRRAVGVAAATNVIRAQLSIGAVKADVPSVRIPHLTAKAKHVIFCFMQGGMSHVDIFDPKPALDRHDGEPTFNDNLQSQGPGHRKWLKSPWAFRQHGQSGTPISSLLPHLANCVDDFTVIRSMRGEPFALNPGGVTISTKRTPASINRRARRQCVAYRSF